MVQLHEDGDIGKKTGSSIYIRYQVVSIHHLRPQSSDRVLPHGGGDQGSKVPKQQVKTRSELFWCWDGLDLTLILFNFSIEVPKSLHGRRAPVELCLII